MLPIVYIAKKELLPSKDYPMDGQIWQLTIKMQNWDVKWDDHLPIAKIRQISIDFFVIKLLFEWFFVINLLFEL